HTAASETYMFPKLSVGKAAWTPGVFRISSQLDCGLRVSPKDPGAVMASSAPAGRTARAEMAAVRPAPWSIVLTFSIVTPPWSIWPRGGLARSLESRLGAGHEAGVRRT